MKRYLSIFLLVVLASFQSPSDCESNFNGKFIYEDEAYKGVYIVTSKNKHVEYYNNGENFIESKKEYTNNCTFKLTITKMKMPGIGLKVGDILYIKVHDFENKKLALTATIEGYPEFKMKLIKIDE